MSRNEQRFQLADGSAGFGLSCATEGAWLAGVPLLRTSIWGFVPRPVEEIEVLVRAAYGDEIEAFDFQSGLAVVAEALNRGDLGRAMVAAVRLKLSDLDPEGVVRISAADEAIAKYDPSEPRDARGRWTTGGVGADSRSVKPGDQREFVGSTPKDGEVNPDTLTPAAYNGFYHDWVVEDEAAYLRSKGEIVETEVRLAMADGSAKARIDILAWDPQSKLIYGIEVKTGDKPGFTPGQLAVYPHLMWGESVVAVDTKVARLRLVPGVPLQPVPVFLMMNKDMFSKRLFNELDPIKMYRYYRGEQFYSKNKTIENEVLRNH